MVDDLCFGFGFIMADLFFDFCVEEHTIYIILPSMMILDILVPTGDGQDRIFVYLYFIQLCLYNINLRTQPLRSCHNMHMHRYYQLWSQGR